MCQCFGCGGVGGVGGGGCGCSASSREGGGVKSVFVVSLDSLY